MGFGLLDFLDRQELDRKIRVTPIERITKSVYQINAVDLERQTATHGSEEMDTHRRQG
jgi:hypothetical protein